MSRTEILPSPLMSSNGVYRVTPLPGSATVRVSFLRTCTRSSALTRPSRVASPGRALKATVNPSPNTLPTRSRTVPGSETLYRSAVGGVASVHVAVNVCGS